MLSVENRKWKVQKGQGLCGGGNGGECEKRKARPEIHRCVPNGALLTVFSSFLFTKAQTFRSAPTSSFAFSLITLSHPLH